MFKLEISYQAILLIVGIIAGIWLLLKLWPILLMLLTAVIFMTALLPYVEWLVRRGLPRTGAVLIVLAIILAVVGGLLALLVPALISEFKHLHDHLPDDARRLEDFLDDFGIKVELQDRARNIDWNHLITGQAALDYGQRIFLTIITIVTVIVLTAYLLVDLPRIQRFVYQFVPPGREPEFERITESLNRVVGGYIRGQIVTSAVIMIFTGAVLLILNIPNAVAYAVLAGFVDIIPVVGALIAVFMPTVAAFRESPEKAAIVMAALVLYQQFEDRFLVPRVYGQTLNLPPVVVLIAILVGGTLLGIPGVLLSLPVAAAGRVGMDYVLERRQTALTPPGPPDQPLAPD